MPKPATAFLAWSRLVIAAAITSLGLAAALPAQAQDLNVTVSPPVSYLQVKPGGEARLAITIQQTGTADVIVTPKLVDFEVSDLTGTPKLQAETSFQYVSTPGEIALNQQFILKPNQAEQIVLSFDIPATAQPREYHLSLVFETQPATNAQQANVGPQVNTMVASNIILLVSHSADDLGELTIKNLTTPQVVDSFGQINPQVVAFNQGPTATAAQGKVLIRNFRNQVVAEFPLYPDVVLAQSGRPLRAASQPPEQASDPSQVLPEAFSYNPAWLLGPYQVEVMLENQATQASEVVSETTTVVAVPMSVISAILAVTLIWLAVRYSGKLLIAASPENL